MSDDYTLDEIKALIRGAFELQIQRPKDGLVALNDDGTNPSLEEFTIPAKVEGQEETYHVRISPTIDRTNLANNSPVDIILNYDGEYEAIGLNPIRGRIAYQGTEPTPNLAWMQHDHEDEIGGGQLNAGLIFNSGVVDEVYGGTGQSVYAVGDLLYASTTTALSKLVAAAAGNVLISGATPSWGKVGLTTHVSGTLGATNGGTGKASNTTGVLLLGAGAGALTELAPGTAGNVATSNGSIWTSAAPATSPWTTTTNVIHPGVLTDTVSIGTNAYGTSKLYVLGDDTGEAVLRLKAPAGHVGQIFIIQNDSDQSALIIDADNGVIVNPSETDFYDLTVYDTNGNTALFIDVDAMQVQINNALVFNEGGVDIDARFEGDNDTALLMLDASTDRVGIGDSTPDGRFAVVGRADEIQTIIRGNATQTSNILEIQDSASNVQVSISGLGAAVFNEEGNDADFRIESDTQVNAFFLDGTNGAIQQLGSAPAAYLHMAASTTSLATYRVPAGTVPSSPGEGDAYNDSTLKAFGMFLAGIMQFMPGRIFTATANAGPSNTTAETTIVGSGIGTTTLAANALTAGKVLKIRVRGMYSTGGSARDVQIRIKLGGVTVGDATISSTAAAANGGRTFLIDYDIRCVSTGVGGTVQGQGYAFGQNVQQGFNTNGTSAADTTGTLAIDVTADFVTSDANCHFTSNILYFELVN